MAEDYPVKPILDQVNQAVINQLAAHGGPPIYTLTPEEARSVLLRAQSGSFRKPDAEVKDWKVKTEQLYLSVQSAQVQQSVFKAMIRELSKRL